MFTQITKLALMGAALGDATLLTIAAIQASPLPSAGDFGAAGVTGAATSLAVLWAWKASTDKRMERLEVEKASKDDLRPIHETLKEMKDDLRYLSRQARRDNGE